MTISLRDAEIKRLEAENDRLQRENAALKRKVQTWPARTRALRNRDQRKAPFLIICLVLMEESLEPAGPDTRYTRTDIQAAFEKELDNYHELKAPIAGLLRTKAKATKEAPYDLAGWAMEHIRKNLGQHVQTKGGRPKKNEEPRLGAAKVERPAEHPRFV